MSVPIQRRSRITAHITSDTVAVWTASEATRLRVEHRVAGSPIGALANHTQQNIVLGLPLLLSPEEVALLVARDAIQFIDMRGPPPAKSEAVVAAFSESRQNFIDLQLKRLDQNADERREAVDAVRRHRHGKRRKVDGAEVRCGAANVDGSSAVAAEAGPATPAAPDPTPKEPSSDPSGGQGGTDLVHFEAAEALTPLEDCSREVANPPVAPEEPSATPMQVQEEEWIGHPAERKVAGRSNVLTQAVRIAILTAGTYDETAPETQAAGRDVLLPADVDLPERYRVDTSEALRRRCRVMADLHSKNYWVTAGVKFGGDFLVYPGDPHRYHSHFVAVVVGWEQNILPHDIVSFGRLGTVVKKALVLCTVGPDDDVTYVTAVWKGNVAER